MAPGHHDADAKRENDRDSDSALFANPPELLQFIKLRELYGWLEETVDACKDAALVITTIIVKGA